MIIDRKQAGILLNQWSRWINQQPSVKRDAQRETGQLSKPNGTISRDAFNEPVMTEIDAILRSDRLTQRQKDISKLEWKIQRHTVGMEDQEQRKRKYNRTNPIKIININQYRKTVHAIKFIVADELTKTSERIIREFIDSQRNKLIDNEGMP